MRNLKTLGLAFVAVLAMAVVAAPAAQADFTDFWAEDGAVEIDATGESVQNFTVNNQTLTCPHVEGDAVYTEETTELTGENVSYDTSGHCHVVTFGITFPIEVDENGCHFTFDGGEFNTGTGVGHGNVRIENCDQNNSITITVFEPGSTTLRCEYHVPEQTIEPITYRNITTAGGLKAVTIEADNVSVETTVTNGGKVGCNAHETTNALYDGDIIAEATNEAEEFVDSEVTGTLTG